MNLEQAAVSLTAVSLVKGRFIKNIQIDEYVVKGDPELINVEGQQYTYACAIEGIQEGDIVVVSYRSKSKSISTINETLFHVEEVVTLDDSNGDLDINVGANQVLAQVLYRIDIEAVRKRITDFEKVSRFLRSKQRASLKRSVLAQLGIEDGELQKVLESPLKDDNT